MISSNVSSIQSHQTWMNNNANNVANVNTDRFVPNSTVIQDTSNGSTQAISQKATDNGSQMSQTDLAKEMTDQIMIQKGVEANVQSIRTQDEMLGSLLDIKG